MQNTTLTLAQLTEQISSPEIIDTIFAEYKDIRKNVAAERGYEMKSDSNQIFIDPSQIVGVKIFGLALTVVISVLKSFIMNNGKKIVQPTRDKSIGETVSYFVDLDYNVLVYHDKSYTFHEIEWFPGEDYGIMVEGIAGRIRDAQRIIDQKKSGVKGAAPVTREAVPIS